MLQLTEATLRRGTKVLFENATFIISPGWKVGVVGRNGTGKTSLFRAILSEIALDMGDLQAPERPRIACAHQSWQATDQPLVDFVLDGDAELRILESAIERAESDGSLETGELYAKLESIGGFSARARAGRILAGLGFATTDLERALASFSGGWQMRAHLARILMVRSDLLLLDEPTNHLDFESIAWLEQWLADYDGTMLLISHDREFLDKVTRHTLHFSAGTLSLYRGSYSTFEQTFAERRANAMSIEAKQQREVRRIQGFVDRFRAKASKARQAQSRLKALSRLATVEVAKLDHPYRITIPPLDRVPAHLVSVVDATARYDGGEPVLEHINLALVPESRVGLIGLNGAGKSTLIKMLVGQLSPARGECTRHPDATIGYFSQHELEHFDANASPLNHLIRQSEALTDQRARDYLGGFGFANDQMETPVVRLSGGERARLALALILERRPSVLLLDEPTNHLDMDLRDTLVLALQTFQGALVIVSHDRHLLRSTADELILIHDRSAEPFDGDVDAFHQWTLDNRPRPAASPQRGAASHCRPGESYEDPPGPTAFNARARRRADAVRRERLRPLTKRMSAVESALSKYSAVIEKLDNELAEPDIHIPESKAKLLDVLNRRNDAKREVDTLEAEWLSLQESIDGYSEDADVV